MSIPVPVPGLAPNLTLTAPPAGQLQFGTGAEGIEGKGRGVRDVDPVRDVVCDVVAVRRAAVRVPVNLMTCPG